MAPKAKRASSPSPAPKGKAKPKAKADAKAKAEPAEDPKALIEKEAQEMFERYETDGIIKLARFADCIRDMNIKKCQIFGDEPGPIIKEHWKDTGGFKNKELKKEEFVAWWPTFLVVVEARQAEMAVEQEKIDAEKAAKAAAKKSMFEGTGIWTCPMESLQDAMNEAFNQGKTPLIIDSTEGARSEVFFTYSGAYIIECKKMIMDKAKKTATVEEILEEQRDQFFRGNCFKYGQTVLFRLGNSACDIKGTFSNEVFPAMKLLDTSEWKKLLGIEQADNFKGSPFFNMCPSDEHKTEHTCTGINEKFRVVAVSHFAEEDYVEFLDAMFPLDLCQPIKPIVT